jgi:phytanoyl-CoA hydroxylase
MRTELTTNQIESYRRDGCLLYENFLTAEELKTLSDAVDRAVEQMGKKKITDAGATHMPEEKSEDYYTRVFLQRLNLYRIDDDVRDIMLRPDLGRMLSQLEGIDGIRVWHDQTLQKMPWGNPTSWHMDCPNWSFHHRNAISIWIALDDATIQNGCMYYLPGSHKVAQWEKKGGFSPDVGAMFEEYPELRSVEPLPAVMKAGDAGFHNGLTAHGAGPNFTPYPRRGMTCAYMPDGATFNGIQNILGAEYMAGLTVGDVLDDDEQTPLVWSKSA